MEASAGALALEGLVDISAHAVRDAATDANHSFHNSPSAAAADKPASWSRQSGSSLTPRASRTTGSIRIIERSLPKDD
jgi:hypothetical protein